MGDRAGLAEVARQRFSPLQLILITIGVLVGLAAAWKLSHLLLLVFGAILIGLMLSWLAGTIGRATGVGHRWALLIAVLLIAGLALGFGLTLGTQIVGGLSALGNQAPDLAAMIEKHANIDDLEQWVQARGRQLLGDGSLIGNLSSITAWALTVSIDLLLVFAGGIYFAAHPGVYRRGLLRLIPGRARARVNDLLGTVATALRHWFVGQILAMLCVGVLTTTGLLLLGVPSAIALGFIAAVLEFVPYVGPILSVVPAVAAAASVGSTTVIWVIALYFFVQQLEAALITPVMQNKAVDLPPGLTIFAIITFGILLGPGGIILGTPLAVVCFTIMRDVTREDDEISGATSAPAQPTSVPPLR